VIRDSEIADQRHLALPQRVVGVIKCKNPRCITSVEREIVHEFKLTDPVKQVYRCIYCEQAASRR
jgi:aspartate carbamoyltransferase regulatory subunit